MIAERRAGTVFALQSKKSAGSAGEVVIIDRKWNIV